MKKPMKAVSIFLILGLILSCQMARRTERAGSPPKKPYKEGEILVKFKRWVPEERIQEINDRMGAEVIGAMGKIGVLLIRIPEGTSVEGMVEKYSVLPEVEYAEPNYIMSIQRQQ